MKNHIQPIGKVILAIILAVGFAVLFSVLLNILLPSKDLIPEQILYLLNGPKSLITMLGATTIMVKLFEKNKTWSLGLNSNEKFYSFSIGVLFSFSIFALTFFIIYLVGGVNIDSLQFENAFIVSASIGLLLAICDTFSEEVLFRGYIQGLLNHHYGVYVSVIVSSVIFAFLHSLGHDIFENPFFLLNLLFAGFFLAIIRQITGSLWIPIGYHFAWNTLVRIVNPNEGIITYKSMNDFISGGSIGIDNGLTFILLFPIIIGATMYFLKKKTIKKFSQSFS